MKKKKPKKRKATPGSFKKGHKVRSIKTQFQKGNTYWKRSDKGRDKIFATPQELWDTFVEYTEFVDANPWKEQKYVGKNKKVLNRRVPYSLMGLVVYCGTSEDYFYAFENSQKKKIENGKDVEEASAFLRVLSEIRSVIRQNQFDGGAASFFREALMMRVLNLVDKQDMTTNGKDLPAIPEVRVYNTAPPLAGSEGEVK